MNTMTFRQKRSNGGYGLRRKVAKKRLDEDFEYNFSKVDTSSKHRPPQNTTLVIVSTSNTKKINMPLPGVEVLQNNKVEMKNKRIFKKKSRGRPKKLQNLKGNELSKNEEATLNCIHLKEPKSKKPNILCIEPSVNEVYSTMEEMYSLDEEIMSVSHEEVVENSGDFMWKRIKLEPHAEDNTVKMTSSEVDAGVLPEGEKENVPGCTVSLIGGMEMHDGTTRELHLQDMPEEYDNDTKYEVGTIVVSRRGITNCRTKFQDHLQGLKHLSSDHKIECSECRKLLKPSSFRQHLRTHTGEKPFCCDICDARFTRKGDVERHVRIVHDKQKPFKCGRCKRAFGDKKNLRWHLMNHDKKLFYICDTCGFKFGKREYWENHVRFLHPLPGGLDPSDVKVGCDDEGYQEIDDTNESSNNVCPPASPLQTMDLPIQENIDSGLIETLPTKFHVIKQNNAKYISVKDFALSNFVEMKELHRSNFQVGAQSVVIEFDDMDENTAENLSHSQQPYENLGDLIHPSRVLHVVHSNDSQEKQMPLVIETQDLALVSSVKRDHEDERFIEIPMGRGQVISIILSNNEGETGDCDSNCSEGLPSFINKLEFPNSEICKSEILAEDY